MATTVVAVGYMYRLIGIVMMGGIYSLLAASVFVVLDAVDVAFTEASVGAGISTVLLLGTIALTTREAKPRTRRRIVPLAIVSIIGAALLYGTSGLPRFGDANAPSHLHVAPRYIAESETATGVPNIVTAVLASYRGYDTLGETTVIFTAGIGVILLLGSWRREGAPRPRQTREEDG